MKEEYKNTRFIQSGQHTNLSYLSSSSCVPSLSQTFQILSIKDFLLPQIPLQTPCTLCGVMTSVCTPPTTTQTQHTTTDCVSVNDMHLKVLVLRRRCLAEQVKEKQNSADAPVLARPSHLLPVTPEGKISVPVSDLQSHRRNGQHGNRDCCLSPNDLRVDSGVVHPAYRLLEGVLCGRDGHHHGYLLVQPMENMCD